MKSLKKTTVVLLAVVAFGVAANENELKEEKGFWDLACSYTTLFCGVTTSASNGGGKQPPKRPN